VSDKFDSDTFDTFDTFDMLDVERHGSALDMFECPAARIAVRN
jgi:hypothetical protein